MKWLLPEVLMDEEECTLSTEAQGYQVCHISAGLRIEMNEVLRPKAEAWIMNAARLNLTSIYGFRRYLKDRDTWIDSVLLMHRTNVNK
jgi:hypothetical protein